MDDATALAAFILCCGGSGSGTLNDSGTTSGEGVDRVIRCGGDTIRCRSLDLWMAGSTGDFGGAGSGSSLGGAGATTRMVTRIGVAGMIGTTGAGFQRITLQINNPWSNSEIAKEARTLRDSGFNTHSHSQCSPCDEIAIDHQLAPSRLTPANGTSIQHDPDCFSAYYPNCGFSKYSFTLFFYYSTILIGGFSICNFPLQHEPVVCCCPSSSRRSSLLVAPVATTATSCRRRVIPRSCQPLMAAYMASKVPNCPSIQLIAASLRPAIACYRHRRKPVCRALATQRIQNLPTAGVPARFHPCRTGRIRS